MTVPAQADPAASVAAAFGAREVQRMSLSPDGKRIAVIAPTSGRGAVLRIVDMDTAKIGPAILSSSGNPEALRDCRWSTDTRLICRISTASHTSLGLLGFSRAIALDRNGGNMKMLSARTNDRSLGIMQDGGNVIDWTADGAPGAVLMTR